MNPRFKYRDDIPYIQIEAETRPDGRTYFTPDGPAPSVTTILATLPHPGLDEWRERVGDEEADRIRDEAARIGTCMHDRLECYVKDVPYEVRDWPEEKQAIPLFKWMRMQGLKKLDEVWGVEVPMHLYDLYAGRTDLVGIYNRIPSIIDYKNSRMYKKDEWIETYKMQLAAYNLAHDNMYGDLGIKQGVILIGIRGNPQFNKPPTLQTIYLDEKEMHEYKIKFMDVVENYHKAA